MYCEVRYSKSLDQCTNKNSIITMTTNIPKLTACLCGMVPFSDNARGHNPETEFLWVYCKKMIYVH